MPIDASIPLGYKAPDLTQNLSGLLNVANSAQTVQNNAISLNERKAMQGVLSDPSNYTDDDGSFNLQKAQSAIMRAAPTTGAKYISDLAQAHSQSIAATQALNNLTTDNRAHIGGVLASLPPDATPELVGKTIDALRTQYKGIGPAADVFIKQYTDATKSGGPQAGYAVIQQAARGVLPQETQQSMNTPNTVVVNNGQEQVGFNTKPGVQGYAQGSPVFTAKNQVGPGGLESVDSDAQGNKFVVSRTPSGAVVGTRPLQSSNPATPGPFTLPPGETQDTLHQAQGIRVNANQAAKTVPDQQFNSNQIIKLADETNTGKGAQILQGLKGGFAGIPWTSDSASNFNQLGHYMALQTAQLSQSSGLGGTDAAHAIAAEQAGNREWTRDAIKNTARVNRALSTGTLLFNQGVENAVNSSGSPFAARDFQSKWSRVASVEALRVYDAYKNRSDDPDGWQSVLRELGGPNSPKFKKAMSDVDAMQALIRGQQ